MTLAEELMAELVGIRSGEGATSVKLADCPRLLEALGVELQKPESGLEGRARLVQRIESIKAKDQDVRAADEMQALLDVLGFTAISPSYETRKSILARRYGKYAKSGNELSPTAINNWFKRAATRLVNDLVSVDSKLSVPAQDEGEGAEGEGAYAGSLPVGDVSMTSRRAARGTLRRLREMRMIPLTRTIIVVSIILAFGVSGAIFSGGIWYERWKSSGKSASSYTPDGAKVLMDDSPSRAAATMSGLLLPFKVSQAEFRNRTLEARAKDCAPLIKREGMGVYGEWQADVMRAAGVPYVEGYLMFPARSNDRSASLLNVESVVYKMATTYASEGLDVAINIFSCVWLDAVMNQVDLRQYVQANPSLNFFKPMRVRKESVTFVNSPVVGQVARGRSGRVVEDDNGCQRTYMLISDGEESDIAIWMLANRVCGANSSGWIPDLSIIR